MLLCHRKNEVIARTAGRYPVIEPPHAAEKYAKFAYSSVFGFCVPRSYHQLEQAGILAGRYNPNGRYIKAWTGERTGIAIVDCLMNLPLLYWASEELHDPAYRQIAINHTEMALNHIIRPDGFTPMPANTVPRWIGHRKSVGYWMRFILMQRKFDWYRTI